MLEIALRSVILIFFFYLCGPNHIFNWDEILRTVELKVMINLLGKDQDSIRSNQLPYRTINISGLNLRTFFWCRKKKKASVKSIPTVKILLLPALNSIAQ